MWAWAASEGVAGWEGGTEVDVDVGAVGSAGWLVGRRGAICDVLVLVFLGDASPLGAMVWWIVVV